MTPCPLEQISPWESPGIPTKCRLVSLCAAIFPVYTQFYAFYAFSLRLQFENFSLYWQNFSWTVILIRHLLFKCFVFKDFALSLTASPWTCGEAYQRQRPRRLSGWQGRLWIQNGWKQSGCKTWISFLKEWTNNNGFYSFTWNVSFPNSFHPGGCAQICCWHHHRQERRDDKKDSEWCRCQDPVQTRLELKQALILAIK